MDNFENQAQAKAFADCVAIAGGIMDLREENERLNKQLALAELAAMKAKYGEMTKYGLQVMKDQVAVPVEFVEQCRQMVELEKRLGFTSPIVEKWIKSVEALFPAAKAAEPQKPAQESRAWQEIRHLIDTDAQHRKSFHLKNVSCEFVLDQAKQELQELCESPTDPEELADLIGVLIHYAIKRGWSEKFIENKLLEKLALRFNQPAIEPATD